MIKFTVMRILMTISEYHNITILQSWLWWEVWGQYQNIRLSQNRKITISQYYPWLWCGFWRQFHIIRIPYIYRHGCWLIGSNVCVKWVNIHKAQVNVRRKTLSPYRRVLYNPEQKLNQIFICVKEMTFCMSVLDANNGIVLYQFVQIISILDANGIILYQFASDGITTITLRLMVSCTVCYVALFWRVCQFDFAVCQIA